MLSCSRSKIYLERVLKVCRQLSDYPDLRGIFYLSAESGNTMEVLLDHPEITAQFPWIEGIIEGNDMFFENLLSALCLTFPHVGQYTDGRETYPPYPFRRCSWPGRDYSRHLMKFSGHDPHDICACFGRVIEVCDRALLSRLDSNRRLMEALLRYTDVFKQILFIKSYIESNDIFFMNLRQALKGVIKESPRQTGYPREWPGLNYLELLYEFKDQPTN